MQKHLMQYMKIDEERRSKSKRRHQSEQSSIDYDDDGYTSK